MEETQISEVVEAVLHASTGSMVPSCLMAAMSPVEKPSQGWFMNCSWLCRFQARLFGPAGDSVSDQI